MAAVAVALAAPSAARAQSDCADDTTPVYTDACGPTFALPGWGDAGGWTDPSKYSTIQLADLNGDGRDELLARNDQGLEIWWFDRGTGQWRPQVDANGVPQTLTDFRSPQPGETLATDWTQPQYYTTIQTAHIDGNPDAQVLARFADGMRVYVFVPGPGGSINGGRWSLLSSHGPFSDADGWNVPSRYSTIKTGNVTESTPGATDLIGRAAGGLVAYAWNGSGWTAQPPGNTGPSRWFDDASCSLPSCWLLFRTAHLGGSGETLVSRPGGSQLEPLQYDSGAQSWDAAGVSGQAFSDVPGRGSDCPFPGTSDCLGSSPSYYETLGTADVNGDGVDEVFARAADGLRVKSAGLTGGTTYDDQGQGGQISFEGGGWTRAQNVPGAINGTETSSSQDGRVELTTDVGNVIQVIGPVGPGLGRFGVWLDPRSRQITWVDQSAPRRREQRVLFEAIVPSAADGNVQIIPGGGTVTIDAMRTFSSEQRAFKPLPTLGALAGTASSLASSPGIWGSIRTGDINGDGADEVLALDGKALQAYSLQGNTWTELPTGSHPLTLTGDWLTKPEYYSTIRVGDVDGDGRDDVVARGPFGIRTWFYNRRGTGGWERYLDQGYPTTPGAKGLALAQLDAQASGITAGAAHIRDVWTTANRPDMTVLTPLTTNLPAAAVGNCGNQGPVSFAPPVYASCVPPAGVNTTGFTAADWTAAVNEMLREAYDAQQAVAYFDQLDQIRSSVFESDSGSLPAIGADLGLAGAAGNSTSFNLQSFFAGAMGVAASAAGAFEGGAGLSAELWIGSELISMLPSASETATSQFQTTYAGLLTKFATAQDEMKAALDWQSQQVRTDQGLLDLTGQLRPKTWQIDQIGIESTARQAFALETYQALLPTMYNRYVITGCVAQPPPPNTWTCSGLPSGSYVIGGGDKATSATFLGPPSANPCYTYYGPECGYASDPGTVPDNVAQNVWGAIPARCNYQPGNDGTVWTYGCPLGIPISEGIGADGHGWTFATETGNPVVGAVGDSPSPRAVSGVAAAHAASAARARASARAPRTVLGPLRFVGRAFVGSGLRLGHARVVIERMLFEHGRREELARSGSGRRLLPFALRHVRGGRFVATGRTGPRVRLQLGRRGTQGRVRVDLSLDRVRIRDIRAVCAVTPAAISLQGRPLELETRLRVRDGASFGTITMRQHWRCVRDREGEFDGIRPIQRVRLAARPGLALRFQRLHVTPSGGTATALVSIANRRGTRSRRVVSSLWNVRVTATAGGRPRTIRVTELRRGRARTIRLSLPVSRRAGRRVCVQVSAAADSARGTTSGRCARAAGAPGVTG